MSVTLHTPGTVFTFRHTPSWMMLAGAAGSVNAFAFLTCKQYVTHLTGTVTRAGIEIHAFQVVTESLSVILWYVIGAACSAFMLQARSQNGKPPLWAWPLGIVSVLLALTGFAGEWGLFGHPDKAPEWPFVLLCILAFAMGLQNAAVATTTGLAVRTTHLTGPAADMGVHLGTAFFAEGKERKAAFKGALLRFFKILGFLLGAMVEVPLFAQFGYLSLLAPSGLVLVAAGLSFSPAWSPSDYGLKEEGTAAN